MSKKKSNITNRIILLLVEGETEVCFYKLLIHNIRSVNNAPFPCEIECKNIKGIGNYKNDALRRFSEIQKKYLEYEIDVILCYDTDVFDLSKKPPVDMKALKKVLLEKGAHKVISVEAKSSIEDWFLLDWNGVRKYLRLPAKMTRPVGKGQNVLKSLFNRVNKVYVKGGKNEGFIDFLDIETVRKGVCLSIKPLCNALGIDCKKICNK